MVRNIKSKKDENRIIDDRVVGGHKNGVSAPSRKRFRPRFATCINCNEEFDVETNDEDSCIWHPGISQSFIDPFPTQTRRVIIDISQGGKQRSMTLTSGRIMTRDATETSIVSATTLIMLKGLSMNAAIGWAIMKVVRWGHTLRGRMYIRRCGHRIP